MNCDKVKNKGHVITLQTFTVSTQLRWSLFLILEFHQVLG